MNIGLIDFRFDPAPLLAQLAAHPEAWDKITHRTSHPLSPHREVSDIWVRYNDLANFHGDMRAFNAEHRSVWYPVADQIPAARELAESVADACKAERLGGVLITKVPARKQVYPHIDQGWHAQVYQKVALQLRSNRLQAFCFESECLSAMPGEAYFFHNHVPHWVINESDEDRITLIVTMKWSEPCH